MRRKALKVVAGKVSLVSRIDSYNNHPDGIEGVNMKADIESKFEKWQEAPNARTKKALPIPEEKKKSKRGGKRISKMKERNKVTEIAQQQNKMNVSVTDGEYGDSAMGFSVGMVGAKDTGRIRVTQSKVSNFNNKHQKKAVNASSGLTNGLSSSMVVNIFM
jgi:U4/U6 small nuclear ribonucleoprotein PRP31